MNAPNQSARIAKRRRPSRGALGILAILLAASGAMRVGSGIGEAMARTSAADQGALQPGAEAMTCPKPPLAVTEALQLRENRVAMREAALADRMAALKLADQAIETRLASLEATEAKLSETLARASGAAEKDLTKLTEMYQSMKPKDAAALFEAMAPEFATGFLGRMRPDAAAAILSGMSAESAYAISVMLAGRNANVPKE